MRLVILVAIIGGMLAIGGCATVSQAQNQCASFGFTPGTDEYANCVQQQYQANRADFQQRLLNASQIMNASTGASESSYGGAGGTAFLKKSYVSGMNRICVYDRLGSAYVTTIGATDICPLTVP
jgi:hypothetical protein